LLVGRARRRSTVVHDLRRKAVCDRESHVVGALGCAGRSEWRREQRERRNDGRRRAETAAPDNNTLRRACDSVQIGLSGQVARRQVRNVGIPDRPNE
jgi:hypothetical protein